MTPNPSNWFSKRELNVCPPHFVKSNAPVNTDSHMWVTAKLKGRFSITLEVEESMDVFVFNTTKPCIAFEDPAEAMIYELRWSGSK